MAKLPKDLTYIKVVTARGKRYEYFDAGRDHRGKQILKRLPARSDRSFASVYAALLGHRTRKQSTSAVVTLATAIREYQLDKKFTRLAPSSQDTYLIYLRQLADQMKGGAAPVDRIEQRDMQLLMEGMQDRPGAANMMLLVARNVFALAKRKHWIKVDPTEGVEPPDQEDNDHEPWPEPLLLAGLADPVHGLAINLLYYTTQRIGDVCKMRWDDIQDDGTIYVLQEKGKVERWIPVHDDLAALLEKAPRATDTILPGNNGKPARKATLRGQLQKWANEQGHDIVPHGLRKNGVNALLEAGCTVGEVSSISGQSLAIVEHYAKRRDNRKMAKTAMGRWARTKRGNGNELENK